MRRHRVAVIDGPLHGDRAVSGDGRLDYQNRIAGEGASNLHDRMRQDWLAALAAVISRGGSADRVSPSWACRWERGTGCLSALLLPLGYGARSSANSASPRPIDCPAISQRTT